LLLFWISGGGSHPEIGRIMGICPHTADKQVKRLLTKIALETRAVASGKVLRMAI